jgi:arylsulfatase A-like enzyme
MHPLRTGMIPPQLPGSPSYLRPGTPALAWFLRDLDYTTGEFGKNHLGDLTIVRPAAAAPRRRPEQVEQVGRHRAAQPLARARQQRAWSTLHVSA